MAYTLADFSRLAETPLKKAVIDIFRKESFIMDSLPIETAGTLSVELLRTKVLPTITARNIGEEYTPSKGETESLQEKVALLGTYIDIPKEYLIAKNQIVNQKALQIKMMTTSLAYKFNDMFINGNPVTNNKEMVGLWYRLVNDLPASQSIAAASGGLDISPDASGLSTNQAALIDKLDELEHVLDGHKADLFIMNSTCFLRLQSALRATSMLAVDRDNFGRKLYTYGEGGTKLIDLGTKADNTTDIIGNVEAADGSALSGGGSTSIYAVKLGEPYLAGFQLAGIKVTDKGELESGVVERVIIDWGVGIYMVNPRSVARLHGIIAA